MKGLFFFLSNISESESVCVKNQAGGIPWVSGGEKSTAWECGCSPGGRGCRVFSFFFICGRRGLSLGAAEIPKWGAKTGWKRRF